MAGLTKRGQNDALYRNDALYDGISWGKTACFNAMKPPGFLAMNYGYQTPIATLVAQIGGIENWRVAPDRAINKMMFADANRRERRRNCSTGQERLDGGAG